MAEVKPLKLKAELITKKGEVSEFEPYAIISVDSGVPHLNSEYTYLVPEKLSEQVLVGTIVEVNFNSRRVLGFVRSRSQANANSGTLKFIEKVIYKAPIINEEIEALLIEVSARFGGTPWDLISSAIPPRVAQVEKNYPQIPYRKILSLKAKPKYIYTKEVSRNDLSEVVSESERDLKFIGQILVIVPDERDLNILKVQLSGTPFVELGSHLAKSERYANYLKAIVEESRLIIGTRSAIFHPLKTGSRIIVYEDNDESMYEKKYPGWNVRDVALLRSNLHSLQFISAAPSLELMRLINLKWIYLEKRINPIKDRGIKVFFQDGNRSVLELVREGLKSGNALICLPTPGYVNSFTCQKCRNLALCDCGGRLALPGQGENPICSLCKSKSVSWRCKFCEGIEKRTVQKGSAKYAEEFGKNFPGVSIMSSNGGHRLDSLGPDTKNSLVIATYGCEPEGEYSAIALLQVSSLANRAKFRATEVARNIIYRDITLLKNGGALFVDELGSDLLSQNILRGDSTRPVEFELEERLSAGLPPFFRVAQVSGVKGEIQKLYRSINENQLFSAINIVDDLEAGETRLLIRSEISKSLEFSEFFLALTRYRSLKGLEKLNIRLDPYSI